MKKLTTLVSAAAAIAVIGFSTANAQVTTSEVRITNSTFRTSHTSNATANQTMRWEQFSGTGGIVKVAPGSPNAISNGTVDLSSTTNVSNTLATTNGGTGTNSLPSNQILIGNAGGTAITGLGNLTNGQLLIGDGDGIPTAATLTAGSGITITNGAGTITIASNINATQLGVTTTTDFVAGQQNYTVTPPTGFTPSSNSRLLVTVRDANDNGFIATVNTVTATDATIHLSGIPQAGDVAGGRIIVLWQNP
ncbi:MAG: hypothetical protein IPM61_13500 [Chlorobi bacterium]|nr:MAG: hypothetical protein UZ07_CHB004002169 [Chlorobi bacterium OLB7]MBK8912331.1 hypothetical protein [Chlorobiota bacterium]